MHNDDAVKAEEDIFSRQEMFSKMQMLFRFSPQGKFEYFNWTSPIYQIKERRSGAEMGRIDAERNEHCVFRRMLS